MTIKSLCVITALCLLAFCGSGMAQTATAPAAALSALPGYVVGIGASWMRGSATPFGTDISVGVRCDKIAAALCFGKTNLYWWSDVSTPFNFPAQPNSQPAQSTITTGGAWVPVQNLSGTVSLIFTMQGGWTAATANALTGSATATGPAFNGSGGVALRPKPNLYVFLYGRAANAATSSSSGVLATAIFQPGFQILYSFGN